MTRHGFLQAGGGSSRFGRDKALVEIGGKTMLQRTGELLAGVCEEISIVAPAGKYAHAPWPVVPDRWPGEGPLGGILTALHHLDESAASSKAGVTEHGPPAFALILSCDMPFLTREFLGFLVDRASTSRAQVVVPQSAGGLEPLCACWLAGAAADVQSAFDFGVRKIAEAMKRLTMEVLDECAWTRFDTEGRLFWNMNTPADFMEARRILDRMEQ
jgi:molybdopterin-guanine dinucleotide biosynthesis protein A